MMEANMDINPKQLGLRLTCPICKSTTEISVLEETVLLNFPLRCPQCGEKTLEKFSIIHLNMYFNTRRRSNLRSKQIAIILSLFS